MSYSLNSINSQYSQPAMGLGSVDKQKIKDEAKNNKNIVNNMVNDHDEESKKYVAAATFASWLVISKIMDKFNAKCRTVDGTSLLHKVQTGSDKLGHKIEDSAVGRKVFSKLDKSANWTKKNIIDKNSVLSAIVNTPAKPELSSPKMMLNGTLAETAQDAVEAIEKYCRNKGVDVSSLGVSEKQFEQITKEPGKYIANLIKICKKMPDEAVEVGSQKSILKYALQRKVYPSELINKLSILDKKSIIGETKNLSRLGKALPKSFLRVVEGLTNGTAGGKIAIAMQAMCFGDAIVRTVKAPKGEKGKTFAESVINDLSFYLMMPLGLSIIYGACGAKYIGMNKSEVQQFRAKLATLNKNVADKTITKDAYNAEIKALKDMLKGNTKILKTDSTAIKFKKHVTNIVRKPFKFAGKVASMGLEKFPVYAGKDSSILDKLKGSVKFVTSRVGKGGTLKGFVGGAMRFGVYMFALAPFLAKIMTKASHLVFGKPTHSILDEDKEEKKPVDKEAEKTYKMTAKTAKEVVKENKIQQQAQIQKVQTQQEQTVAQEPYVRQNLLDKYRNVSTIQTSPQVTTSDSTKAKSRYIPSTNAVKKDYTEINARAKAVMDKSIAIENDARSIKEPKNYLLPVSIPDLLSK